MGKFWRAAKLRTALLTAAASAACVVPAFAQQQTQAFNIPAQNTAAALNEFSRQAGVQILFPYEVARRTNSQALQGEFTRDEALQRLTQGTQLSITSDDGRTIVLADSASPTQLGAADAASSADEEIVVTGTRIRGSAPVGSPIVVIGQEDIARSGYTNTEQLIQSLPQNIRSGAEGATADASGFSSGSLAGFNATRGSGANLRGLGANATLTLINGRRISSSGFGTFTDISLIPLSAIDRVEVLTDGASAIYGADAVAGVVNIILRRDYDGAETRLRYGFTDPDGRQETRVSQTLGNDWGSGNALIVLDYLDQSELEVSERDATSNIASPTSIYPSNEQFGVVLSGSQNLTERFSIEGDAQYATVDRQARGVNASPAGIAYQPIELDRVNAGASLVYRPTDSWDIRLDGQYSNEDGEFSRIVFATGSPTPEPSPEHQTYQQTTWSVGLQASGTLIDLPGGPLGVAVGAAHRTENFQNDNELFAIHTDLEREIDSAFVEFNIPLFGPDNHRTGLERLNLSLAGRYDDYSDFGETFNHKIGISWVPIPGLELRSSYSTSFRAPAAGLELTRSSGGANPNALIVSFATPDGLATQPVAFLLGSQTLQPEEATNWTAGFDYRPEGVPGLEVSLTYYDIEYTNKIITPPFDQGALSNPILQQFVTTYASPAAMLAALGSLGVVNYFDITGACFCGGEFGPNPENVTTVVYDSRFRNAGIVNTSGIDFAVGYSRDWSGGTLDLGFNANYIAEIDTALAPGFPSTDLAGTTGNPAGLRLRLSTGYARGGWDFALATNYTDSYTDTSGVTDRETETYVTVDGQVRYTVSGLSPSAFDGVSVALSVTNLFDEQPPFVQASGTGGAHYDPANADVLGRLIALEIIKRW